MINEKPLFSIVIVNYNHGKYLESAILSVLNQSFKDFELIMVDGGSTDNSLEIINKYKKCFSWWVSEKDKGQSDAFNKGFSIAKGEFYFWLNADDLLLPSSLKIVNEAILKYPNTKWFSANTILFDKNGLIRKCSVGLKWSSIILKNCFIYVNGPSSIFHNSIFKVTGGFDVTLNYTMDVDLWYKFYNLGEKFIRINCFMWGFRIHNESKTSHAFISHPDKKYQEERECVQIKNNHIILKKNVYMMYIYKIISGVFFVSKYYSYMYRKKNINSLDI